VEQALAAPEAKGRQRGRTRSCELCGRDVKLTFHHLIPRAVHKRTRFVERHGKEELRSSGLWICRLCHSGIHTIIPDEKVLAESYCTRDLLLGHEGIVRHIRWARKQK
jgi:hypothetical protein